MILRTSLLTCCWATFWATAAVSQGPQHEVSRAGVTRAALESLLVRLDEASRSPAYGPELRTRSRQQGDLVRARLRDGDFQVGDRIRLSVEMEQALTDTFSVQEGRVLDLPQIGRVPLDGVLRSELVEHLRAHLSRFIRNPVVRAQSLIRISITGDVARQGFYTVPTDMLVSDVLMVAGGPVASARLEQIRVERAGDELWSAAELQPAIIEGRTLDALSIRAGDRVVVPGRRQRSWETMVRTVAIVASLPFTIIGLINLIK